MNQSTTKKVVAVMTAAAVFCSLLLVGQVSYAAGPGSSGTADLDYIETNIINSNRAYKNNGSGTFSLHQSSSETALTYGGAFGDIDNDGDIDYIAVNYNNSANHIYKNNGSGSFSLYQTTSQNDNSYTAAFGDIDNDGDLDLIVGNYVQANRVYKNNGSGSFTLHQTSSESDNTAGIAVGDLDNDGDLDYIAGNAGQPNRVYKNNGSGSFSLYQSSSEADSNFRVVIGDIDSDGDLDYITVSYDDDEPNRVYKNNGSGSFSLYQSSSEADQTVGLAIGDIDGDGDLDYITGNYTQPNRVYKNNGSGSFSLYQSSSEADQTYGVALGDLDDDGDLDYIASNYNQGARIYKNNGSGSFSLHQTTSQTDLSFTVLITDIDNDGSLIETNCTDGIDNDHDAKIDQQDEECQNSAPSTPFIGPAPSFGYVNVPVEGLSFSNSTDPDGDTIRFGIDWNNDSIIDEYAPTSGYIPGTGLGEQEVSHTWSTPGTKTFQVLAEDDQGAQSGWASRDIDIEEGTTVVLTSSTSTYRAGDPAVELQWSSSGAYSCSASWDEDIDDTSGTDNVTPTATTEYTITCTGPGGSDEDSVTVTYAANNAPNAPTISGPTSGTTGTTYNYTIETTDPEGDGVTIGIDCNMDDLVDAWAP